jgi:beta-exotoxin I transport system permease protein
MIAVVLRLELRRSRSLAIGLGAIVLLYGSFIAAFYPVIRDNAKLIDDYMAVFPKGMLAAFGMEGTLSNHGVFFNTYIGSMLWPVVAAIAAAILGTRQVAADLDRGFIELPMATRIDRGRYLATGIAGQILVLAGLSMAVIGAVLAVGIIVGAGFDGGRFLMEIPLLFLFACALSGIATLLSVVTLSRQVSAGLVAGGLLVMYLLDAVSRLQADLAWLGIPSFFRYLRSTSAIDQGLLPLGPMVLFGMLAVVTWGLSVRTFRGRDLVA